MHMLTNVVTLVIFLGIWLYRRREEANETMIILAEVVGIGLLTWAGWIGGTQPYQVYWLVDLF